MVGVDSVCSCVSVCFRWLFWLLVVCWVSSVCRCVIVIVSWFWLIGLSR